MLSKTNPIYFVHPWVDGFFIGFASFFLFFYLRYFQSAFTYSEAHLTASIAAAWLVNWPHIFATYCRLYQKRESRAQYPFTAYVLPFFIFALSCGALYSPEGIAPYLVKILFLWSPFHFSGQTIGIFLLYSKRGGLTIPNWARNCAITFVYASYLYQTAKIESSQGLVIFSNISYPLLGIPSWTANIFLAITLASMAGLGWWIWSSRNTKKVPWIVMLPLAVQYLWFVHGNDLVAFQLFLSSLHGLQYLLIAWAMQVSESKNADIVSPGKFLLGKTIFWFGITFTGGAFLFFGVPKILQSIGGWDLNFSNAVMLATFQIHHFFVDGVIWKLRNAKVSSPLLMHLPHWISNKGGA